MGRVDQFRTERRIRWRYTWSFVLFFLLLIAGVCTVDYSINSIARNVNNIELITVKGLDDSNYEVSVANKKFQVDTKYLKRDYESFKKKVSELFNKY